MIHTRTTGKKWTFYKGCSSSFLRVNFCTPPTGTAAFLSRMVFIKKLHPLKIFNVLNAESIKRKFKNTIDIRLKCYCS